MQHVLNIAFDFDDKHIKEVIDNQGEKWAEEHVKTIVESELFDRDCYGRKKNVSVTKIASDQIRSVLDENKDYIIQEVIKNLTQRILLSKAGKEIVSKIG